MVLWRIGKVSQRYRVDDMSGAGAAFTGGRWNAEQVPAVYTATSISLAALETLVHHKTLDLPVQRMLLKLEVPEALWAQRTILNPEDCPGWNAEPASHPSVDYGSAWLRSNAGLLLEVPSVIVPEEKNVIINPHHADLAAITVTIYRPWVFDSRLKE